MEQHMFQGREDGATGASWPAFPRGLDHLLFQMEGELPVLRRMEQVLFHRRTRNVLQAEPMPESAFSKSEMMIVAAARELAGQRVCFVGVGLPNIAVNLAKRTVSPQMELVYESGVFGANPARLPLSIGDPTIVTGATAVTSMHELFAFYLQGGL